MLNDANSDTQKLARHTIYKLSAHKQKELGTPLYVTIEFSANTRWPEVVLGDGNHTRFCFPMLKAIQTLPDGVVRA